MPPSRPGTVRLTSGKLAVAYDDGLVVKFSRSELQGLLFPGEASFALTGAFLDGKTFEATETLRVIP